MKASFDPREDSEVQQLLKKLEPLKVLPLVGRADLREIVKVFPVLPELEYPINSAAELIDKIGGPKTVLKIEGVEVSPLRMIKYMPAYYFPIASADNFVEKMAELIRSNRKQVDIPKELSNIKRQLPELRYPIQDEKELIDMIGSRTSFRFQGREIVPEMIIDRLPPDFFPVETESEFFMKMGVAMSTRSLIKHD